MCETLNEAGYALGLDDYVAGSDAEALMRFVKFVKVDVLKTTPEDRTALGRRLIPRGIRLIAEKVETPEMVAETHAAGYRLFQGYYFLRPTMLTAKKVPDGQAQYLRLLTALSRPDLSVTELEAIVKSDVSISYRVLGSIHSSAYAIRRQVSSIREALVLLGRDQVRKWASVWVLAGLNSGGTPETLSVALLRARACERLGEATGHPDLFLLGLCSVLDAIVGRPMAELVAALPLSVSITDALLGRPSEVRQILDATIAYERGRWDEAERAAASVGLPPTSLPDAYADALVWVRALPVNG